jgi:ribosomal protein L22
MVEEKTETKLEEKKTEEVKPVETKEEKTAEATKEDKKETKPEEKKADKKVEKKAPKTEAVVNSYNAHLSTKTSAAVCRFIVGKTLEKAISDLGQVASGRVPVPMKGEIPHRHGKIMSGRFPKNASEHFIMLLRTLVGNSLVNGLEDPIVTEAIANIGNRPYGKFGAVRRKRTHIKIIAKSKTAIKNSKKKKSNSKTKSKNKKE